MRRGSKNASQSREGASWSTDRIQHEVGKQNYQAKAFTDMAIEILRLRGELAKAKQQADAELSKP